MNDPTPDVVRLDTTAEPFHDAVATALGFPPHYGRNLDALADCLRDVDPATTLVWTGWSVVEADSPHLFRTARSLLDAALTLTFAAR